MQLYRHADISLRTRRFSCMLYSKNTNIYLMEPKGHGITNPIISNLGKVLSHTIADLSLFPKIYECPLKVKLDRLVKLGVLKQINNSEWAIPMFIISNKDATVMFISDLRGLNKCFKCNPFLIPKIQDLLLKLEGFQNAMSLDLNMGYYHIELMPFSKRLSIIVMPWGKYKYQHLPMGLCNSPDIFQKQMFELFSEWEYVWAYIDDLLVMSCSTFEEHLKQLEKVLLCLSKVGLKVNANKSHFAKFEIEYLGYWITRNGIQPLHKKVEALQNITPPKNKKN